MEKISCAPKGSAGCLVLRAFLNEANPAVGDAGGAGGTWRAQGVGAGLQLVLGAQVPHMRTQIILIFVCQRRNGSI